MPSSRRFTISLARGVITSITASVVAVVAVGGGGVAPAHAIPTDPDEIVDAPPCLADLSGALNATPTSVVLGGSATLKWSVYVPRDCVKLGLEVNGSGLPLNGQPVARQGSLSVRPSGRSATSTYALTATSRGRSLRTIATTIINVELPRRVTIDRNDLAPLLIRAVGTEGVTVRVLNRVELDLTGYGSIRLASGVRLFGGRTSRERGPLLYSNVRKILFLVQTDDDRDVRDVRISGLRIRGPDSDEIVNEGDRSTAIHVNSAVDVEIDHNELYGWKNSAIRVTDHVDKITYNRNPWTVRIHDNYIHHNQEQDSAGYGVAVGSGAFALIDRNTFDYNRHAVSGDGSDDSGYRALRNLILQHGGRQKHQTELLGVSVGIWGRTHQFDMHGQEDCWGTDAWCGTAGYAIEIYLNSFLYAPDGGVLPDPPAIRIRGTPQLKQLKLNPCGAVVSSNVFAHYLLDEAVKQNETGVCKVNNRLGIDGSDHIGSCDFDGDGTKDRFMATGQTWWYATERNRDGDWIQRARGDWIYLNTSRKLLSQLTLGQFDRDPRCDVVSGGFISSGGTTRWRPR
jgi:hypothetical protein